MNKWLQNGNVTLAIDANFKTTYYNYDADNRLTKTVDPDGYATTDAYDAAGNLTMVVDPVHNSTTFAYDGAGRKTAMIDAFGQESLYAYDGDGNLTQSIDRDNRVTSYVYDGDNRLLTETLYPAGGGPAYDTLVFTYDADGSILTAGNNQGTYTLSYDNDERVTNVIEPFGVTLAFLYDKNGNRTSVVDSFGGTENSSFNAGNLVFSRTFSKGGVAVAAINESYDLDKQLTQLVDYAGTSPSTLVTTVNYTRNGGGLVTGITDVEGISIIVSYAMTYDAANNLTRQVDHGFTNVYGYDNANQLLSDAISSGGGTSTIQYSYDANGNRNMTGYSTTYNNELTTDGNGYSYTYDLEGNEITKTKSGDSWTFSYDNGNHMVSAVETQATLVTSTAYKFDVFGNMVEEDVGSAVSRYAYDDWNPAKAGATGNAGHAIVDVMNGSNALITHYMDGDVPDQHFVQLAYSGTTYTPTYYLTDQQGSIRDVVNAGGSFVDQVRYDAYGNITAETNASNRGLPGWDGYFTDAPTGLLLVGVRVDDPKTSRWMQQDPWGFAGGDANLYRETHNQPTVMTDPSGLAAERPVADGSTLQWITQARMGDLVGNGLAHTVGGIDPHRVIFMPYGNQIRGFDYKQVTNPGRGGTREWALARSYGFAPIDDPATVGTFLGNVDTGANANRLARNTDDEARTGATLGALQTVMTGITLIPLGAAVEAATRGDYVNAAISFVGDVALIGSAVVKGAARLAVARTGAEAAGLLARANTDLVRFRAVEGAIAVTRVGQSGYAVMQGENGQAAGYLGEAALRIFGVAYARRVAPPTIRAARRGGSYSQVRAANVGGDIHHMPANSVSPLARENGPAIWMETRDHAQTKSFANDRASRAYREQQRQLILQGRMRDAIQMDIDDIQMLFGNKYNQGINQMLEYARQARVIP